MSLYTIPLIGEQPSGLIPRIDWSNPLTQELRGLLYTGDHLSIDLVTGAVATKVGVTVKSGSTGRYSSNTGGTTGIYTPQLTQAGAWLNWYPINTKITFAFYGNWGTGVSGSNVPVGMTSTGYRLFDLYSTRTQGVQVRVGASNRTTAGSQAWVDKICLKALTYDGVSLIGYDDGKIFGSSASAGAISYGTSDRLAVGGVPGVRNFPTVVDSHWAALWGRVLSPGELRELNKNPWSIFVPDEVYAQSGNIILPPTLSDLVLVDNRLRLALTY